MNYNGYKFDFACDPIITDEPDDNNPNDPNYDPTVKTVYGTLNKAKTIIEAMDKLDGPEKKEKQDIVSGYEASIRN